MPTQDQLEIISPTGEITFYDLDPSKGITNIGRHPENDIVIESPGVALFHAVLHHRQKPYQILVMGDAGLTTLGGQPLPPNTPTAFHAWETVELDGHSMMLLESAPVAARPTPAVPVAAPSEPMAITAVAPTPLPVAAPTPEVGAPTPAPAAATPSRPPGLAARPADKYDEVILSEVSEREWTIEVEQTAVCDVTITNGGGLVATFDVQVEGIDPDWVVISPPRVNLVEGEHTTVTISITPPREPSSRAGAHHLAVAVTSPNHPDRRSQSGATLTINPFYEFTVGELVPKQQTISYRQRSGEAVLHIANLGNSDALFRFEAYDDERACSFEFQMPGETTSLAQQAERRLPPEQTFAVPVQIIPRARKLVGLRKRRYSYTVTSSVPEGALTPRSLMGQLSSKPLIGPGLIALMLLCLAVVVVFIFNPKIGTFEADSTAVLAGTPVALYWEASTFANLNIDGLGQVPGRSGRITVEPLEATNVYRLKANNWLSSFGSWFGDEREISIAVTPVYPMIRIFEVSDPEILTGESIVLRWEVVGAERLVLKINGAPQELLSTEHVAQRQLIPDGNTTYILDAFNRYTGEENPISASRTVQVLDPTPTPTVPPPTPVIEFFQVEPNEITLGEKVTFDWSVSGEFDTVLLDPLGEVDIVGPLVYEPEREGTLGYWLKAFNGPAEAQRLQKVLVGPAPTKTPEPILPEIQDFRVKPEEVVLGDGEPIELFWLVTGDVTDVQISGPGFGPVANLAKEGSLPITAEETTFFILTAFGLTEDQIASATVELTVLEPTPEPTQPPPTATPWPLPIISYFRVESDQPGTVTYVGGEPPTYEVVVGSRVKLSWQVQNAVKVTLEGFGDEPDTGTETVDVFESRNYHLIAENVEGAIQDAFLRIELKEPEPPPPPFNLAGMQGTQSITLTWSYPIAYQNDILGFRVYRATVPPGDNFAPAATLTFPLDTFRWIDTEMPVCGKAYYIVALYWDILNNEERETDSSSTSWLSGPCTTP